MSYDDDDSELPQDAPKDAWGVAGPLVVGASATQGFQADLKEPGEYTIEFGIVYPAIPDGFSPPRAEALITWSVAGFSIIRKVTIGNGTTISGAGQAVAVVISDAPVSIQDGLPVKTGLQYNVTAAMVKGVRPPSAVGPILMPDEDVAGVGSGGAYSLVPAAHVQLAVPQGVGVTGVSVMVGSEELGSPIPAEGVAVLTRMGTNVVGVYDPRIFQWVPLIPGTDNIRVVNSCAQDVLVAVYFSIDG